MVEWIYSSTGEKVPRVDGHLLDSIKDPLHEASKWCDRYTRYLKDIKTVFVLGLGAGYHVKELARRWPDLNIIVIEAAARWDLEVSEKTGEFPKTIKILCAIELAQIFSGPVVSALSSLYFTVRHGPSMKISPEYYESVLSRLSARDPNTFHAVLNARPALRRYFETLDMRALRRLFFVGSNESEKLSIHHVSNLIRGREGGIGREGMLWMALRELVV